MQSLDVDEWERLFVGLYVATAVDAVWEAEQREMGVTTVAPPRREDYDDLRREARRQAELVVAGSAAALYREFDRARKTKQGESAGFVRRLARGLYRRSFTRTRAGNIAAQTVLQATSQVQYLSQRAVARVTGGRVVRVWTTVGDDRVREAHRAADGDREGVDGYFIVGGEKLRRPRDPAGSTWNIINCRCSAPGIVVGGASTEEGAVTLDRSGQVEARLAAEVADAENLLASASFDDELLEVLEGLDDDVLRAVRFGDVDPDLRDIADDYRLSRFPSDLDGAPGRVVSAPNSTEVLDPEYRGMFRRSTQATDPGHHERYRQVRSYAKESGLNENIVARLEELADGTDILSEGMFLVDDLVDREIRAKLKEDVQSRLGTRLATKAADDPDVMDGLRSYFKRKQTEMEQGLNTHFKDDYLRLLQNEAGDRASTIDTTRLYRWLEDGEDILNADELQAMTELYSRQTVSQWAKTSNDSDFDALWQQRAVAEEFYRDDVDAYDAMTGWLRERAGTVRDLNTGDGRVVNGASIFEPDLELSKELRLAQAYQRSQYQETQEWLQRADLVDDEGFVTMWRGVDLEVAGDAGKASLTANPASSWSVMEGVSQRFALQAQQEAATMFQARIPAERILGSARTGVGCLSEFEMVVLAGPADEVGFYNLWERHGDVLLEALEDFI